MFVIVPSPSRSLAASEQRIRRGGQV